MGKTGAKAFLFALILLLAACGNKGEPFQVVRAFPEDGYQGFRKNEVIEIAFNAPVDEASLPAAYRSESEGLKPDQVTLSLHDGGRVLEIAPQNPLPYSPDETRLHFRFTLGTELRDRRGRHLAAPFTVTFSTLRTRKAAILSEAALDGFVAESRSGNEVQYLVSSDSDYTAVGDSIYDQTIRGFLAFAWPEDLVEPLTAELRLFVPSVKGDPFQKLGKLAFELMDLGDRLGPADYLNPPLIPPTHFEDGSGFAVGQYLTYPLTDYAEAAFARGLSRLDLRLSFEAGTNQDQSADAILLYTREAADKADPELLPTLFLTYLAP